MKQSIFILTTKDEGIIDAAMRIEELWEKVYGETPNLVEIKDVFNPERYEGKDLVVVVTEKRGEDSIYNAFAPIHDKEIPVQFESILKLKMKLNEIYGKKSEEKVFRIFYYVPLWTPDSTPSVDAFLDKLRSIATKNSVKYIATPGYILPKGKDYDLVVISKQSYTTDDLVSDLIETMHENGYPLVVKEDDLFLVSKEEAPKPKCFLYEFKSKERWDRLYASVKKLEGDFYEIYPFTLDLSVAASYFKEADYIAIPEDQEPPFTGGGKSIKKYKMKEETEDAQNTDDSPKCPLRCGCDYSWFCPKGTLPGSNSCMLVRPTSPHINFQPFQCIPYQSDGPCCCECGGSGPNC